MQISKQEAVDRLRSEDRSQFGRPGALGGDASAERRIVCQSLLDETSNKMLSGLSRHTTRHTRL